jgi:hypothetical protein
VIVSNAALPRRGQQRQPHMLLISAARCSGSSVPVASGPSGIQSDTCRTTKSKRPIKLQWSYSLPSVCSPAGTTTQTCWKLPTTLRRLQSTAQVQCGAPFGAADALLPRPMLCRAGAWPNQSRTCVISPRATLRHSPDIGRALGSIAWDGRNRALRLGLMALPAQDRRSQTARLPTTRARDLTRLLAKDDSSAGMSAGSRRSCVTGSSRPADKEWVRVSDEPTGCGLLSPGSVDGASAARRSCGWRRVGADGSASDGPRRRRHRGCRPPD